MKPGKLLSSQLGSSRGVYSSSTQHRALKSANSIKFKKLPTWLIALTQSLNSLGSLRLGVPKLYLFFDFRALWSAKVPILLYMMRKKGAITHLSNGALKAKAGWVASQLTALLQRISRGLILPLRYISFSPPKKLLSDT